VDPLRIAMDHVDVDPQALEDQEVLQVVLSIPQVGQEDLVPDLVLTGDHLLGVMVLLTTTSKDLHLEEVGEVLAFAEAAEVAEVFAMDLLDLEALDLGVMIMVDPMDLSEDLTGIKVVLETVEVAVGVAVLETAEVLGTAAVGEVVAVEVLEIAEVLETVEVGEVLVVQAVEVLMVGKDLQVLMVQTAEAEVVVEVLMDEKDHLVSMMTVEVVVAVEVLETAVVLGTAEGLEAVVIVEVIAAAVVVQNEEEKGQEVNLYPMTARKGQAEASATLTHLAVATNLLLHLLRPILKRRLNLLQPKRVKKKERRTEKADGVIGPEKIPHLKANRQGLILYLLMSKKPPLMNLLNRQK